MLKKRIFPCNQEPLAGNIALNCANLPRALTMKKKKEKSHSHLRSTLSNVAQCLPLCLQPPSFSTWTNRTIVLVPELSFSFHICSLQIFLSPPPFWNAKAWTASLFLQATITSGHGEKQTPLLLRTLPSCPWHRPYQMQRVISHLLAPCRRVRQGLAPPWSEQTRNLVDATASGTWNATSQGTASNAVLVQSRPGSTAPWFHQ